MPSSILRTKEAAQPAAEWIARTALKPWAKNPRHNEKAVDQVVASIKRFGFGSPILARRLDNEVIAGHTRLLAAEKLGLEFVPVRFLDLDPADAHLLALADNKLNEIADWDDVALAALLDEYKAEDAALAGFDAEELERLEGVVNRLNAPEPEPETASVVAGDVMSVPGEVYELGPHRLLCGDCCDAGSVAILMDGNRIAVAITSPPYASQRVYDEESGFKPIPEDEYVAWFEAVQANVRTHLAEDGSWFVNIKEHARDGQRSLYVKDLTIAHVRQWGWLFVDEFCWRNTGNGIPGKFPNRFKNAWEPVFHFSAARAIKLRVQNVSVDSDRCSVYSADTHRGMTERGYESSAQHEEVAGLARPSNVIELQCAAGVAEATEHTAQFPVALPMFFIMAFSDRGDIIFDPFLGSGTTLMAAAKSGRVCYGTEISPRYCDLIRRRWGAYAREAGLDAGPGAL